MFLFAVTVNPHERVLEHRFGRLTRVLEPGRHRRLLRASYQRVADAAAFVETTTDPSAVIYLAVRIALREAIAGVEATQAIGAALRTAPTV